MEKVRPWCGQPSDRGRLKTEQNRTVDKSLTDSDSASRGLSAAAKVLDKHGVRKFPVVNFLTRPVNNLSSACSTGKYCDSKIEYQYM